MAGVIFGLLRIDRTAVADSDIDRLAKAVTAHAACGAPSLHVGRHAAIGAATLWPEGAAEPPSPDIVDADGTLMAADLRLDRSDVLTRELALPAGTPQPELIAAAWQRWGPGMAAHLRGDFALAALDPETPALTLLRDIMGVRPLAWTMRPGEYLAFASLPAALVDAGFASGKADTGTIAHQARLDFTQGERTALADVRRVRPAHVLTLADGTPAQARYWSLECRAPIRESQDFAEVAAELRSHVERAVARRVPQGGARIGTHLSGGLDSSSVAVVASRIAASVTGYAIRPARHPGDPDSVDSTPYVEAVAQANPGLRRVFVDATDPGRFADAPLAPDMPVAAWEASDHETIHAGASAEGIGLLLTGIGGDQLVSQHGDSVLAELVTRGRLARAWTEARALGRSRNRPAHRVLANQLARRLLPPGWNTWLRDRFGAGDPHAEARQARFLRNGARRAIPGADTRAQRLRAIDPDGIIGLSVEALAIRAARHGVALAHPFLDRDLMEFAIRLPATFLLRGGVTRAIFREALTDVLPDAVRLRDARAVDDPTMLLRVCEARDRFVARLDAMKAGGDSPFDLARIRAAIEALPSPDVIRARINEASREGRQPSLEGIDFLHVFTLLRFLDEHAD